MAIIRTITALLSLILLGCGWSLADVSPVTSTSKVYFADLNGDGLLDLAHSDNYIIRIYLNQGTPSAPVFTDHAYEFTDTVNYQRPCPAFCDIDLDGDMDFFFGISIGTIVYHRNDGTATNPVWTRVKSGLPGQSYGGIDDPDPMNSLNFVDFDGDGDQDITYNVVNGEMRYYRNQDVEADGWLDGQGVSWQRIQYLTPFYAAGGDGGKHSWVDEDGDGDFDCLIGYAEYGISIRRNRGGPSFHQNYTWESLSYHNVVTGSFPSPFLEDFDADGFLDIQYTSNLGYLRLISALTRSDSGDQDALAPAMAEDALELEEVESEQVTVKWPVVVDAAGSDYRSGLKCYELHRSPSGPGFTPTSGTLLWRHYHVPHHPDVMPETAEGDKFTFADGYIYYRDAALPPAAIFYYRLRVIDFAGNVAQTEAIESGVPGDLNLDGVLDAVDLNLLAGYLSGNSVMELIAPVGRADLNGDGLVNSADLVEYLLELAL